MAVLLDELVRRNVEITVLAGAGDRATTLSQTSFQRGNAIASDGRSVSTLALTALNIHDGAVALKIGDLIVLPGGLFYEATGGGRAAGTGQPATVSATAPNLDLLSLGGTTAIGLAGRGASPLIGLDGGTLIGLDGGSLIGLDGGSLIGLDGGTLIGLDGGSLIGLDGGTLIGLDGGTLIGLDGGSLIGLDGGTLVAKPG